MRRKFFVILLLIIAVTTNSSADNLGYSKSHPLIFGVDMDYAPLEYVSKDGIPQGLDVEFTQKLMERLDIPFTYSPNTWHNIADDVLQGRVDLGMMVYSPYRKNITNYSRAVFRLYYQIVFRKEDSNKIGARSSLKGKHIAYMKSRPVTDTLTNAGAIMHIVDDLPQAFNELSKGKYDAVICFRYQAHFLIENNQLDNLTAENMTLAPREYCYVSHSKPLIDLINDELVKMESEGIIDEVYGHDVTTPFNAFHVPRWAKVLVGIAVVSFLLVVIFLQIQSRKKLKQEIERAQQSEMEAQRNEQRALESEQTAIRSRMKAENAEKAARRSEQIKTVFLQNVSHALRTPLNAIIGFSDLMRTDSAGLLEEEDKKQLLESIHQNGEQLLYFINELIQLSAIEGNNIHFDRVTLDLRQLMEEFATAVKPNIKDGVELVVEGPDNLHPILDPNQMRTVVMHKLRNAAQHTERGSITLSYRRETDFDTDGKKRDGLRIDVMDTGSGVPLELRENIFSLLQEKNTFLQNDVPGLGLSICAAIVHAAKGNMRLETETGIGSTFIHWIPCEFVEQEQL